MHTFATSRFHALTALTLSMATACSGTGNSREQVRNDRARPRGDASLVVTRDAEVTARGDAAPSAEASVAGDAAQPDGAALSDEPLPFYDPPLTEEEGTGELDLGDDYVPEDPSMPGLGSSLARVAAQGASAQVRFLNQNPTRPESVSKMHVPIRDDEIIREPATGAVYALLEVEGRRIAVLSGSSRPTNLDADYIVRTPESLAGLDLVVSYWKEEDVQGSRLSLGLLEVQMPDDGIVVGATQFAPVPISGEPSCVEQALLNLDLPDLDFNIPPVEGCSKERCVQVVESWLLAHYSVFRIRQMIEYMAEHSASLRESFWYSYPEAKGGGPLMPPDPPYLADLRRISDWFGGYVPYRFEAIRRVYKELWDRFRNARVASTNVRLICPDQDENPGNICFTFRPNAHHSIIGYLNLCSSFFSEDFSRSYRTHILMHELLHHTWVKWKEDNKPWKAYVLVDNHTHGHGNLCTSSVQTEPMYNEEARHLATYKAENGHTCWHRNYALRNPDNYAQLATNVGFAVYEGKAVSWPYPPPVPSEPEGPNPCDDSGSAPNPGPPFQPSANSCQKVGMELFCPHPGTEGGVVELLDALELHPVCP